MGLTVEPTDPYVVTCKPDFWVHFAGEPRSAWRGRVGLGAGQRGRAPPVVRTA